MTNKKKKGFKLKQPGRTPESTPTRIKQKKWTDDQMLTAISDVKKGIPSNQAADAHGVSRSTSKYRISERVMHGVSPWPARYLSTEEEALLADYLLKSSDIGYGKTRRDVCC